jgi:hypothetical protein
MRATILTCTARPVHVYVVDLSICFTLFRRILLSFIVFQEICQIEMQ